MQYACRSADKGISMASLSLTRAQAELAQSILMNLCISDLLHPEYRPDVTCSADAARLARTLPLIYIWDEHDGPEGLDFTVGLNRTALDHFVRQHVSPDNEAWEPVRKALAGDLHAMTTRAVLRSVKEAGLAPSEGFPRRVTRLN